MPRKYRTPEENEELIRNTPGCIKFISILVIIAVTIGILYGCVSCIF